MQGAAHRRGVTGSHSPAGYNCDNDTSVSVGYLRMPLAPSQ